MADYKDGENRSKEKVKEKTLDFRETCIFAIDDYPNNIVLYSVTLEKICQKYGYEMEGDKRLTKLLEFGHADIILLDLNLPNTDGFELFKIIKARKEYKQADIIAISASEPATVLNRLMKLGFAGLITKPINISGFPRQLRKILCDEDFVHIEYRPKPKNKFSV